MKMALVLCATIIFSLLPLLASQPPMVIASSNDMTAIPDDTRTFVCTFIGHSVPYWVVNGVGDSPVTITQGNTESFFYMPNVPPIVDSGTVAQLEVSVNLTLNGTTYVCHIDIAGGTTVASDPAKLTVFGPPLAPFAFNSRERYQSVRVSWERPWSSDLAPVTSYKVQLLQSNGTVQETDTVDVGLTIDREKTFDNLMHNTDYKAQVAAVNSVGQGPWSNEVTFTTLFPNLPTPPVDIKLTVAIAGGEATVTVSWTAPTIDLELQTKVTEYTIFYGLGDFANEATRPASDTFYEIQNIELFSTFQLKMTATNSRGPSEESGAVNIDVWYLQNVFGVGGVKHLNITCIFASSIDIELQCSVDLAGPTAMKDLLIDIDTNSATAVMMVSGLDPGTYNITAKAVNADGSDASPYTRKHCTEVTTEPTEPPEPPPDETPSEPPPEPPEPSTPEPSATPTPPVAPRGTTFTTEQIGIIAGVVVGVFLALILVPCCIFSCFVIFQK